jgi:hypothetical protein
VRLFLGAHGAGLTHLAVIKPGFLADLAAAFDHFDLAAGFIFHRLGDEAHGIDVLDLAARA